MSTLYTEDHPWCFILKRQTEHDYIIITASSARSITWPEKQEVVPTFIFITIYDISRLLILKSLGSFQTLHIYFICVSWVFHCWSVSNDDRVRCFLSHISGSATRLRDFNGKLNVSYSTFFATLYAVTAHFSRKQCSYTVWSVWLILSKRCVHFSYLVKSSTVSFLFENIQQLQLGELHGR